VDREGAISHAWWLKPQRPNGDIFVGDERFVALAQEWIVERGEMLALFRYSRAGGAKDFCFFRRPEDFTVRLETLRPDTSVILFRQPQLSLRGIIDEVLIDKAVSLMRGDAEIIAVVLDEQQGTQAVLWEETKEEFRTALREHAGRMAAIGSYPPWLDDSEDVIDGFVPGPDGAAGKRCYELVSDRQRSSTPRGDCRLPAPPNDYA
jgi:hypothetical protein